MSEQIDWSKAPEGASHFCNGDWFKKEGGKWCYWFDGARSWTEAAYADPANFSWWGLRIERPSPAWSGDGLPPVGVVCEVHYCGEWEKTEILCIGVKHVFIRQIAVTGEAFECSLNLSACQFRPIRTTEQIAADEREAAIKAIVGLIESADSRDMTIAEAIYNAGYRKP